MWQKWAAQSAEIEQTQPEASEFSSVELELSGEPDDQDHRGRVKPGDVAGHGEDMAGTPANPSFDGTP